MRFPRHSIDYELNWCALREMEEIVPMTKSERRAIHKWVAKGFDIESNPWNATDEEGLPLNYLRAYRLEFGFSSGPWDFWKGPEDQWYWDSATHSFSSQDEF